MNSLNHEFYLCVLRLLTDISAGNFCYLLAVNFVTINGYWRLVEYAKCIGSIKALAIITDQTRIKIKESNQ